MSYKVVEISRGLGDSLVSITMDFTQKTVLNDNQLIAKASTRFLNSRAPSIDSNT